MKKVSLLPCPFCGADKWGDKSTTAHVSAYLLWHKPRCYIGRLTMLVVGSDEAKRWNERITVAHNQDVPKFLKRFEAIQMKTAKSKLQLP